MARIPTAWPQRGNFTEAIKAFRIVKGISLEEMAALLGIKLSTLHGYMYRDNGAPGPEVIKKLAALTGRSVLEWMDDPGAPPEGAGPEMSDVDRYMLRMMGRDLVGLTETQKDAAYDAWKAIIRGYK